METKKFKDDMTWVGKKLEKISRNFRPTKEDYEREYEKLLAEKKYYEARAEIEELKAKRKQSMNRSSGNPFGLSGDKKLFDFSFKK